MPRRTPIDNEKFPRINTRITRQALDRVNYACEVRARNEPRPCPQGQILVELILAGLDPTPEEKAAQEEALRPQRKRVKSAKRDAETKAQAA